MHVERINQLEGAINSIEQTLNASMDYAHQIENIKNIIRSVSPKKAQLGSFGQTHPNNTCCNSK